MRKTSSNLAAERIQPTILTPTFVSKPKKQDESLKSDLQTLTKLQQSCKKFTKDFKDDLSSLLEDIGKTASEITWHGKNQHCIRNRFGKFNFATTEKNAHFIDFDRLSHLQHLASAPSFRDLTLRLLEQDVIVKEFNALAENCFSVKKTAKKKNKSQKIELNKTPILYKTLDELFDTYTLVILTEYCDKKHYEHSDKESLRDPKERYRLARIICIIGEACKHLSESYKQAHPEFPFKTLSKIRDILVHHHNSTTALDSDEIVEVFEMIASSLVSLHNTFEEAFKKRLQNLQETGAPEDDVTLEASKKLIPQLKELQTAQDRVNALEQSINDLRGNIENITDAKKKRNAKKRISTKKTQLEKWNEKLESLRKEIGDFRKAPELDIALTSLQEISNNVPADFIVRSQQNIKRLVTEMNLLKKWHGESQSTEERNLALEHVSGIVAEHCNLARSAYHKHVSSQINPTVHFNLKQTVATRNEHVMHAPFGDHSSNVVTSLQGHTIPSYVDISSVAMLAQQQIRNITEQSDQWSVDAWYEYGLAHLRLENYEEAENCFHQALEELDNLVEQLKALRISATQEVLLIDSDDLNSKKYLVLTNLGLSYFRQQQFDEAIDTLLIAYDLFKQQHDNNPQKYNWSCPYLLVTCLLNTDRQHAFSYYTEITERMEAEHCGDPLCILQAQYAIHLLTKNKQDAQGVKILNNIDFSKIHSAFNEMSIQYSRLANKVDRAPSDANLYKALLEECEEFNEKLKENSIKLLTEAGHEASRLKEKIEKLVKFTATNYAAILSNEVIKKSGPKNNNDLQKLLNCLTVQKKYEIDTHATHYNLGLIYYELSIKETRRNVNKQFLESAISHYKKSFKGDESDHAFNFHRQISFAHEDLGDYGAAMHHASKAYCMRNQYKFIPQDIQELSSVICSGLSKQLAKDNYELIQHYMDKNLPQAECLVTFYKNLVSQQNSNDRATQTRMKRISQKLREFEREIKKRKTQLPPSRDALSSSSSFHQGVQPFSHNEKTHGSGSPPSNN